MFVEPSDEVAIVFLTLAVSVRALGFLHTGGVGESLGLLPDRRRWREPWSSSRPLTPMCLWLQRLSVRRGCGHTVGQSFELQQMGLPSDR